jgi:hypothetical protein
LYAIGRFKVYTTDRGWLYEGGKRFQSPSREARREVASLRADGSAAACQCFIVVTFDGLDSTIRQTIDYNHMTESSPIEAF